MWRDTDLAGLEALPRHQKNQPVEGDEPELSILIVTYGNPDLTRRCLASVAEEIETVRGEVLVCDNHSPDSTPDVIAAEFPWVDLIASDTNHGFARGNNLLAERASGRYLLLLNPDAILFPGSLRALLDAAADQPTPAIIGGRTLTPDGALDPKSCWGFQTLWSLACFATGLSSARSESRFFNPEALSGWDRDSFREVDVVTGCLLLVEREVWKQLNGFDETFWMYGEDHDLAVRARSLGYHSYITPLAVATHVVGASSQPGRKASLVMESRVRLMRKHWSPWRVGIGCLFLWMGCGLRALLDRSGSWSYTWRNRRAWLLPKGP